ncbi:hypothetical protein J6590_083994 [Homalodisca vitripennis]|nr:hypothetical protein J6590_083994 [Homalodisca vitripennis]
MAAADTIAPKRCTTTYSPYTKMYKYCPSQRRIETLAIIKIFQTASPAITHRVARRIVQHLEIGDVRHQVVDLSPRHLNNVHKGRGLCQPKDWSLVKNLANCPNRLATAIFVQAFQINLICLVNDYT